ncbi:hypothetical protein HMI56_005415 [Coelomomyces lativittatus]|nr:hypothetical protein HMI56_005415 [Coelomomyces lativittatus]
MGIRLFYPFALMSIYLYLLIQTPKTARGQDAMYNDAEKTCSDLSMNTGLRGATQKISESLDNFMDVMIDKFKDLYLSISPPGLYHVLGLLANVADENSKSLQEIEEWMVKKKENKPNDLFNFNRRMKELNFNSSVLYYYPRSLGKPSSKLSFVVKESGGLLFQEKGTVNYQISKKTGERLKNYELPENEKSNVILNIVSFTFQWVEEFYSTSNGQKFKPINADEYTAHTIFTPSEVPYFQAGSEHPLTPNLSAVQLSLKGKDGKKIEGMSVYLIDTNRNQLRMVDWDTAFVGLKKKEKTVKNFEMILWT